MTDEQINQLKGDGGLLDGFLVPLLRRSLDDQSNVGWLLRNLTITEGNRNHPRVGEVMEELAKLYK